LGNSFIEQLIFMLFDLKSKFIKKWHTFTKIAKSNVFLKAFLIGLKKY